MRRNDLCPCGSGKKVKHCCVELVGVLAGNKEPAYGYVVMLHQEMLRDPDGLLVVYHRKIDAYSLVALLPQSEVGVLPKKVYLALEPGTFVENIPLNEVAAWLRQRRLSLFEDLGA